MNRVKVLAALAKSMGLLALFLMVVVVLSLKAAAQEALVTKEVIPFEEARIIIEFNSTAQDVGIQVFFDGETWKEVSIVSPDGKITEVKGKGNVKDIGLTELFFEGDEPSLEDLPLDEFLALFPEGEYKFFGKGVEGEDMASTATFTHNIPCEPEIVSPEEGAVVDPNDTVAIRWKPVKNKVDNVTGECDEESEIDIAGYEIIIEKEPFDPFHVFDVKLPASATRVRVPRAFL